MPCSPTWAASAAEPASLGSFLQFGELGGNAPRGIASALSCARAGRSPITPVRYRNTVQKLRDHGNVANRLAITQTEINRLMISFALSGMDVVRLKSGDPGIFGRLAEELDALGDANVMFEVVPGVTTALAAAASLGVALTDRRSSSKLVIVSGHHANGIEPEEKTDWRGLVDDHTTLVVYMPGRDLETFSRQLMEAGLPAEIPSVVISRVSSAEERRFATTLGELSGVPATETPSILLVGQAIGRASERILAESPIRDYEAPTQVLARRFAAVDEGA